jgi:hypothetical protein
LNQFYEHKTAADHAGDLLVVRLASINQTLDPWVYILSKKVNICNSTASQSLKPECALALLPQSGVRMLEVSGGE